VKAAVPFSLAALALAASSAAMAQNNTSSVTVYGVVDANVQVLDGASTLTRVQSGGINGSRLGFRGSEDLGGGLRAIFTLESGINLDDGSTGQGTFWGRQAYVGLATPLGTVTLGRQYGSLYTLSSEFSEFSNNVTGASTAIIGGFGGYEPVRGSAGSATGNGGPARVNNSIKYESVRFGGFSGGALVGLGEVAGNTSGNRVADVFVRYADHGFDAMLSFVDDKAELTNANIRSTSGAASYTFGPARVTGGVISVDDRSVANADGEGYWIGGSYRLGGTHLLKTQYVESKLKSTDGKTKALGLGYQYDLSKRTALYTSVTQFKNEGTGYTARAAGTFPGGVVTAGDPDITEVVAGIRHAF
jgi:predicted porin